MNGKFDEINNKIDKFNFILMTMVKSNNKLKLKGVFHHFLFLFFMEGQLIFNLFFILVRNEK